MDENNNVLTIRCVEIPPIRNMITAIKDILTDATIKFTKYGMKINNFDKTHTILVNVMLQARNFDYFDCKPDKIIVCANTLYLFKVISMMANEDLLTIFIENEDYHEGIVSHLGLQYMNGNIKQCSRQKLRLIEPDTDELVVPDIVYSTVITLPSTDFQKIIRDMNAISDRVEIKSVGNDIIFSCEGNFASSRIIRSELKEHMQFINKPDDLSVVMQGEFSLKSLSHFIKCTPLCPNVEINLGNDLPLIVKYKVANLGEIKLCLAPLPPS